MQYDQRILKEKVEELLSEADELDSLKSIAEAQLREALNNIQVSATLPDVNIASFTIYST